jgi:prevent-host-death family protein
MSDSPHKGSDVDAIQVNIHEAKTRLSKLIQAVLNGKQVIIAKNNNPIVRLEVLPEAKSERKIGNAKGLIIAMDDDFDEPLACFKEYME